MGLGLVLGLYEGSVAKGPHYKFCNFFANLTVLHGELGFLKHLNYVLSSMTPSLENTVLKTFLSWSLQLKADLRLALQTQLAVTTKPTLLTSGSGCTAEKQNSFRVMFHDVVSFRMTFGNATEWTAYIMFRSERFWREQFFTDRITAPPP